MLKVTNLSVGYEGNSILQNVNFELPFGLNVLLGQNGSGKTTLFRTLSGNLRAYSGSVTLNNRELLSMPPKTRAGFMAMVAGNHQTLSGITGEALAEMAFYHKYGLFTRIGKREKEMIKAVASELCALPLLTRPLEKMSAGERQTVELVAAICQDTPILLMDEPTSALDFNRTHDFLMRAKTYSKEKILLMTLHDPGLALTYADRVLLLKDGKIVGDFMPNSEDTVNIEKMLIPLYPNLRVVPAENRFTVIYRP